MVYYKNGEKLRCGRTGIVRGRYVRAVLMTDEEQCSKCVFFNDPCDYSIACTAEERIDGKDVYFVEEEKWRL